MEELTKSDIDELTKLRWPEEYDVEYKKALPMEEVGKTVGLAMAALVSTSVEKSWRSFGGADTIVLVSRRSPRDYQPPC